jgi:transcriptional regulator
MVRQQIAIKLVREDGFTFAEIAHQLETSTSVISKSITKAQAT